MPISEQVVTYLSLTLICLCHYPLIPRRGLGLISLLVGPWSSDYLAAIYYCTAAESLLGHGPKQGDLVLKHPFKSERIRSDIWFTLLPSFVIFTWIAKVQTKNSVEYANSSIYLYPLNLRAPAFDGPPNKFFFCVSPYSPPNHCPYSPPNSLAPTDSVPNSSASPVR